MTTATIKIWGQTVGAVAWDSATGMASFEFASEFKSLGWDLAPRKMPLSSNQKIFTFPSNRAQPGDENDTFKGLPGLVADALPDRYGNQLINIWLAAQGRETGSMNPVEMLCFIGSRAMGALEFEPSKFAEKASNSILEIDGLVEIAKRMLSQKESFRTNIATNKSKAMEDILRIGTSAGGARPKALIAYNSKTGAVKSGQTLAPKGFEHWLLKLDGVSDMQLGQSVGYGRVEMAYYDMATACGIEMMESRLLEENGRAHFMTKRFDREGGSIRHHIQTFCAMEHYNFNIVGGYSYEQLFQTMRQLKLDYKQAEQMFRRMVFNVLARNCDDHTKNVAFRLKKGGVWELAPAYDICHAYNPTNKWVSQHALSINGKRDSFAIEDLLAVAKKISCKNPTAIIDEVRHQVQRWNHFAQEQEVPKALRISIGKTLLPLGI